jgi:hypothetical protein
MQLSLINILRENKLDLFMGKRGNAYDSFNNFHSWLKYFWYATESI